jgi:predicted outer membrane lipoprotein
MAYAVANGPLRLRGRGVRWTALVLIPCAFGVALALWAHLSARAS